MREREGGCLVGLVDWSVGQLVRVSASTNRFLKHVNYAILFLIEWLPNVLVRWLTFLLYIQEVPGSNLSLETSYPD
jgi:hypothetical protein